MKATVRFNGSDYYCDVTDVGRAVQHVTYSGIGVYGCNCGQPECTGGQNFAVSLVMPLPKNGIIDCDANPQLVHTDSRQYLY